MDPQNFKTKLHELKFKAFFYKALMEVNGIKETDKPADFLIKLSQLETLDSLKNEALALLREIVKPQIIGENNSKEETLNKINNLFNS